MKCLKSKKVMYSEEEGKKTADILNQINNYQYKLRTYLCEDCEMYHLTKAGGLDE